MRRDRSVEWALVMLLLGVLYVNFCLFVYAQVNPHLTQTQVWHRAWEAVTWAWLR